jgi:hypothetical protein
LCRVAPIPISTIEESFRLYHTRELKSLLGKRREVYTERHAYDGASTSSLNHKPPEPITTFPFTFCRNTVSLRNAVQYECWWMLLSCCVLMLPVNTDFRMLTLTLDTSGTAPAPQARGEDFFSQSVYGMTCLADSMTVEIRR